MLPGGDQVLPGGDPPKAEKGTTGLFEEATEKECDSVVPGMREASSRKMHQHSTSKAVYYPLLVVLMCLTSPSSSSVDTGYDKATHFVRALSMLYVFMEALENHLKQKMYAEAIFYSS